jgi:hypothetical protein
MVIPFPSANTPIQAQRSHFAITSMQRTNKGMLRTIAQSYMAIADARKCIRGANALLASAAFTEMPRP